MEIYKQLPVKSKNSLFPIGMQTPLASTAAWGGRSTWVWEMLFLAAMAQFYHLCPQNSPIKLVILEKEPLVRYLGVSLRAEPHLYVIPIDAYW